MWISAGLILSGTGRELVNVGPSRVLAVLPVQEGFSVFG